MASFFPSIGSWYQELATGQLFEIVAFDDKSNTIEVQYEDGDIAEFELESWAHLDISMAAEPNPGTSAMEFDGDYNSDYMMNPLDVLEGESFLGFDDF